MEYKVLITTSGIGQRLGDLTKYTNKSLVRIGKKPAISYVVEAYPADTKYVVTLGYFGEQVKEFLLLAYPDRSFEFVTVDTYSGPGSSLGYSMLQARSVLQCPFIYHASDTIITESVPEPTQNWIGVCKGTDSSQYASWQVVGGKDVIFNEKGALDFDFLHIGLIGINAYELFWEQLQKKYDENPQDSSLNDCRVIVAMQQARAEFSFQTFHQWYDIGNIAALQHARTHIADHFDNLDKIDESIFIFKDCVIKFFYDEQIVKERAARAQLLSGLVPALEGVGKNFYRYAYTPGHLYADVATPDDFVHFLAWAKQNLWIPRKTVDDETFKAVCRDFYYNKTVKRIEKFLEANQLQDQAHIINGEEVPSIKELLMRVDFELLSSTAQMQFHGDFILDNILKTDTGYCLIDWRHNFGGLLQAGDMYYDLAKLNHNLTVNHDIVNKNLFTVRVDGGNVVHCDILRKEAHVACQRVLMDFAKKEGFDPERIKLLSGLIWLNMAPLHHHPFNHFLYYFGKLQVWRTINRKP